MKVVCYIMCLVPNFDSKLRYFTGTSDGISRHIAVLQTVITSLDISEYPGNPAVGGESPSCHEGSPTERRTEGELSEKNVSGEL